MLKLSKIIWSLAILFVIIFIVTFSLTIISVGVGLAGLLGIYRYYFSKKKIKKYEMESQWHPSGEIIDIPRSPGRDFSNE